VVKMRRLKRFMISVFILILIGSTFGSAGAQSQYSQGNKIVNEQLNAEQVTEGIIMDGIRPLGNSIVIVQSIAGRKSYEFMTNSRGIFKAKLPDGAYALKMFKSDKEAAWYSARDRFSVENGTVKTPIGKTIKIGSKDKIKEKVDKSALNFLGTLLDGDKGIGGELLISKYTEEYDEEPFAIEAKNNGQFAAALNDGQYRIFGVAIDGGFYRNDLDFTVENGEVFVGGKKQTSLTISLPVNEYSGQVHDSEKPLNDASVILERKINEEESDFIQIVVTDNNGRYQLRELPDGSYSLSISHSTFHEWGHLVFEVVNGELFVDGMKAEALDLKVPDLSLNGQLHENGKPVGYASVFIEEFGEEGYPITGFDIPVDDKGNFAFRLKDGSYKVHSIYENGRNTIMEIPFVIKDGKLIQDGEEQDIFSINLPPLTFSGKLFENGAVLDGEVQVERVSEEGPYQWYYAQTDESGVFSLRLADGQYRVTHAYLYSLEDQFPLSISFEIRDGKLFIDGSEKALLEIHVPPVTLNAVVKDGDSLVTEGDVVISTADDAMYYHDWIQPDGTFSMRLPDGDYLVREIYLMSGETASLYKSFSILDGKLFVGGQEFEVLELILPPVTLTGLLTDGGNPIGGDINIVSVNGEEPRYYWGWAQEDGRFSFRIPDGDYQVYYLFLNDGTIDSSIREFSIISGQLHVNGERADTLTLQVSPITLNGTVTNGDSLLTDGYVRVVSLDEEGNWQFDYGALVNYDGTYNFRLPDGKYELINIYTENGPVYFNKGFTIEQGKIYIDGVWKEKMDLNLLDGTPDGNEPA
jgi:hypothetical protein